MEIDRGNPMSAKAQKAQIRTLFEEQRHAILADCHARVSHHELQAAQADEERSLQGQPWQQKLEFHEAHQRSLTEMEELRKFQSSNFDALASQNSSRTRTLFWNYQAEYKNCKMK